MGANLKYGPFDLSEGSGVPTEDEVHQCYCKVTGRPFPIADWNFFIAFSFLRLAVIVQGVAMRAASGQASQKEGSGQVEGISQAANWLCDLALEKMEAAYRRSSNL